MAQRLVLALILSWILKVMSYCRLQAVWIQPLAKCLLCGEMSVTIEQTTTGSIQSHGPKTMGATPLDMPARSPHIISPSLPSLLPQEAGMPSPVTSRASVPPSQSTHCGHLHFCPCATVWVTAHSNDLNDSYLNPSKMVHVQDS